MLLLGSAAGSAVLRANHGGLARHGSSGVDFPEKAVAKFVGRYLVVGRFLVVGRLHVVGRPPGVGRSAIAAA